MYTVRAKRYFVKSGMKKKRKIYARPALSSRHCAGTLALFSYIFRKKQLFFEKKLEKTLLKRHIITVKLLSCFVKSHIILSQDK